MALNKRVNLWFFFGAICINITVFGQHNLTQKSGNTYHNENFVSLQGKSGQVQNCNSVRNAQSRIYIASQSGAYFLKNKSTQKIPFGESLDSLFETGNSKKLTYNENTQQLVCCYPKYGIAILNRINSKSFFQLLQIDGFNPSNEVSGLDYIGKNYVLHTVNKLIVFTIKLNMSSKLFEAQVLQQITFGNEGLLNFCKSVDNRLTIITAKKGLKIFSPAKNGNYKEILSKHLTHLEGVTEVFALKNFGEKYFAGTSNGLYTFSIKDTSIVARQRYLSDQTVYSICFMHDSSVYAAGSKGLFLIYKSNQLVEVAEANNQQDKSFLSTVYDIYAYNNIVWLASQEGVAMFDHRVAPFYAVKNTQAFKPNHVYQIGEDGSDNITLSCENGLYNYSKSGALTESKKENTYFLSAKTPDNRQLVSSINHTYIKDGNSFISVEKSYPEFKGFESLSFNDFEYTDDGGMILSTENEQGVYKWDYLRKKITRVNMPDGQPQITQVNNLYKKDGDIFILTDDNVYLYSAGGLKKIDVLQGRKIMGMFFDMLEVKGHYFLTSYNNGVIETDSAFRVLRIFDINSGLSDNGTYRLESIGDSMILVSTNNGLNAVNINNGKVKIFTTEDGLHSNVFEEFSSYRKDGRIYFGGKDGFTIVNPAKMNFSINSVNNLHFTDCKVINDKNISNEFELNDTAKISFGNNITQVTISFHNLVYPYKERIKYSYKISELHNYWIELGNTNFVTLPVMSPGTYHLQVKAANDDGVWSEPKELILVFKPKWYQSWWFYLLIVLAVAAILYALYRYRISQIKKQHEIRKNIATDLHDDLGSTLNSVKVFTNLAISGIKQEESLQQVKDNLTEATMSLRDMIWVLDDSLDTVDELVTRLKQFAMPVAAASNIEAIIKADSEVNNRQLTKEEKRNLFLICKEAINNSIKYSGASHINIDISTAGKKIQIIVADNGKGFNPDEVKKGYGLKNMQYRAGQIKYKSTLSSTPGRGTELIIRPTG